MRGTLAGLWRVAGQWMTRPLAWGQMSPRCSGEWRGLFLVLALGALGGSCRKGDGLKNPGSDDEPIFEGPPSVARCDRRRFPDFVTSWTLRKMKGALQNVGKVTNISPLTAGPTHRHTECVAGQALSSGQILLFMEALNQGSLTRTTFSPFWIVKPGSDPSPDSGWYLADRLAY